MGLINNDFALIVLNWTSVCSRVLLAERPFPKALKPYIDAKLAEPAPKITGRADRRQRRQDAGPTPNPTPSLPPQLSECPFDLCPPNLFPPAPPTPSPQTINTHARAPPAHTWFGIGGPSVHVG